MHDLSDKEKSFVDLKKEFDEYEKNNLIINVIRNDWREWLVCC